MEVTVCYIALERSFFGGGGHQLHHLPLTSISAPSGRPGILSPDRTGQTDESQCHTGASQQGRDGGREIEVWKEGVTVQAL